MNTANVERLSVGTYPSQTLIGRARRVAKKANVLFWSNFCCQNKTDCFITVQRQRKGFLKCGLLNLNALFMRGYVW